MNPVEERIASALHALADRPVPPDLAGRALAGATRRRHMRLGASSGAVAMATAAVMVASAQLNPAPGGESVAGLPSPPAATSTGPAGPVVCDDLPHRPFTLKEVDSAQWPGFVRAVVAALPARSDYVMQSGYAWCDYDSSQAYAVINLGHGREQGHLTVNMWTHAGSMATDCATIAGIAQQNHTTMLFCTQATANTKVLWGMTFYGQWTVGAIYSDGRAVAIEALPAAPVAPPAITAEQLRTAILDPRVHDAIPDHAAPPPPSEPPTAGKPLPATSNPGR